MYEGSFIINQKMPVKIRVFYAINKILARVHTLTRPSFLYVTAKSVNTLLPTPHHGIDTLSEETSVKVL